jgi:pilus assembly protein Flp/PilA
MLQRTYLRRISVANFFTELVMDQLPNTRSGVKMLAFYTNLSARLHRDEKGATAVEYGIMVALIAVVIIVAVTLLGGTLQDLFGDIQCQIKDSTKPNWVAATQTCAA